MHYIGVWLKDDLPGDGSGPSSRWPFVLVRPLYCTIIRYPLKMATCHNGDT